jgi:hypothetical protein
MAPRGLFYVRLAHEDWDFVDEIGESPPFDAAIVRASYLAPYPEGHPRVGEPADRLTEALGRHRIDWGLDPATAAHGHRRAADWTRPRASNCPLARTLPLPLTAARLSDPSSAEALVEAAAELQLDSRAMAAPYLEVAAADDPRVAVNCELIRLARDRAGDRRTVAYLQTTWRQLMSGDAAEAGERYVDAGAATVFVRIRRFEAEQASEEEVLAYLALIRRVRAGGARPVPDSVGRLGPVLVAGDADGFAAGAHHFRKVADQLLSNSGGGGGPLLVYEVPSRVAGVVRGLGGPQLPNCPEPGCAADAGLGDEARIREHNLHEFRRLARRAAELGPAFAQVLRSAEHELALTWARALDRFQEERRAA